MPFQVHRLAVDEETAQEELERSLNRMKGERASVVSYPVPKLWGMGAASKVKFLLGVESSANP